MGFQLQSYPRLRLPEMTEVEEKICLYIDRFLVLFPLISFKLRKNLPHFHLNNCICHLKNIMYLLLSSISLTSFIASALALVGRDRYENYGIANEAHELQVRHKDWKSRFWNDHDDHTRGVITRTVTVTVTVNIPAGSVSSGEAAFPNATSTVDSGTTPILTDDLVPITGIDTNPPTPASGTGSTVAQTPVDGPILVTSDVPSATENPGASLATPTPIENDLAPITLIDINALGVVKARAPKGGEK